MKLLLILKRLRASGAVTCLACALHLCVATKVAATITEVSYWRMGENDPGAQDGEAVSTQDPIGGRTMTLTNGPFYESVSGSTAPAHTGSSFCMEFFGGTCGMASLIPSTTNNCGMEFWVNPSSSSGAPCLVYNGNSTSNGFGIFILSGNYQGVLGGNSYVGSVTVKTGVWVHLALVINNGVATLYTNGVSAGSANAIANPPNGTNIGVAANPFDPAADQFGGYIDEVRVFTFAAGAFSTNDLLINAGPPTATTGSSSGVGATSATVSGTVASDALDSGGYFQYGTSTNYGSTTPATLFAANTGVSNISATISSLAPDTVYHFRATGTNSAGTNFGSDATFTTQDEAPSATTQSAMAITTNSATLDGSVNPDGAATSYYFEYGLTTNYGQISATNSLSATNVNEAVGAGISSLLPATLYHCEIVASNSLGTTVGGDQTFTTLAEAPSVVTDPATALANDSATLNGSVDPNGDATAYYFQYGLDTNYGQFTATNSLAASQIASSVSAVISGLTTGATYHFQVAASNSVGTVYGADQSFTAVQDPLVTISWWHLGENDPGAAPGVWASNLIDTIGGDNLTLTGDDAFYTNNVSAVAASNADSFLSLDFTTGSAGASGPVASTLVDNFGVEIWAKATATTGTPGLIVNGNGGANGWGIVQQGSTYQGLFGDVTFIGSTPINTNVWTHLALVCAGGVTTFYANGAAVGTYSSAPKTPNGSLNIAGNSFRGLLDEARVFTFAPGTFSTNYLLYNITNYVVLLSNVTNNGISDTGATLSASVTANTVGSSTVDTYFLWGTSTAYGNTNLVLINGSNAPIQASVSLSALVPNTVYHYKILASNALVMASSGDQTFTTLAQPPIVSTQAATAITTISATLNGSVNPNGEAAGYYFQYGVTTNYGQYTATNLLAATNLSEPVSAVVSALQPNTPYHFALVATNVFGAATSSDATFTTAAELPLVTLGGASPVNPISERLFASINPWNSTTYYSYSYGTDSNYQNSTEEFLVEATNIAIPTIVTLNNLTPNTTYQCKLFAANSAGTTTSPSESFTTTNGFVIGNSQTITWLSTAVLTNQLTAIVQYGGLTNFIIGQNPTNGQLIQLAGFATNGNWQYVPSVTNGLDRDAFVFYAGDSFGALSPAAVITIFVTNLPYAFSEIVGTTSTNTPITNVVAGMVASGVTNFSIASYPTNGYLTLDSGFATNGKWNYSFFTFATNLNSDLFWFQVTDSNGHTSLPASVSISLTNLPYAFSQSVAWYRGQTPTNVLTGMVTSGLTNFVIVRNPTNGTFVPLTGFATNGLWQYTATNAVSNSGPDNFQFKVEDSGGHFSSPATVTIFVTNAVYAISQSIGWARGQTPVNQLTGIVASGPTNFAIVQNPLYGQIVQQAGFATNGFFQYSPYAANFFGTDSFTFTVHDSSTNTSLPGTISITVTNIPVAPIATFQPLKTRPDQPLPITLFGNDNGNDPDFPTNSKGIYAHVRDERDWNPTFTILSQPTYGYLTGTPPNLVYTPTNAAASNSALYDGFSFKVNNGALDSTNSVAIKIAYYNFWYWDDPYAYSQPVDVPLANPGTVRPDGGAYVVPMATDSFDDLYPDTTNGEGLPAFTADGGTDDGSVLVGDIQVGEDGAGRSLAYSFGTNIYTNFFINNNGLITFQQVDHAWVPTTFPAGVGPAIAPFWSDVNTTNSNPVCLDASIWVNDNSLGGGGTGRPAVIITWPDVADYNENPDQLNRFQVVMIDRSDLGIGKFDIEFNYEYIEWILPSDTDGVYPGAGYDDGDGINYSNLPGAETALVSGYTTKSNGNPAIPGRFVLRPWPTNGLEPAATNLAVSAVGATNATFSAFFNAHSAWTPTWFAVSNMITNLSTNVLTFPAGNILSGNTNFVALSTTAKGLTSGCLYTAWATATNELGAVVANTNNTVVFATLPRLSSLSLSQGSLLPSFNPAIAGYFCNVGDARFVTVSNIVENLTTNPVLYQINGGSYSSNGSSISLNVGENLLNVMVRSSYATTNIYSVTIDRVLSSDSSLTNLAVGKGALSPAFASAVLSYSDYVSNAVTNMTVTATTTFSNATLQISGGPITTNTNSASVALNPGTNSVPITVTAEDGVTVSIYSLTAYRSAGPPVVSTVFFSASGQLNLQFTGATNASYTVKTTTNLALPLSNWTSLGAPAILSSNIYQFIDTNATNAQQFYMLETP